MIRMVGTVVASGGTVVVSGGTVVASGGRRINIIVLEC